MTSIMVVGAFPSSLVNFRGDLLDKLTKSNNRVTAMASSADSAVISSLKDKGVRFESYSVNRNGLNPLSDFKTYLTLRKKYLKIRPDVVLAYTIKPIIWGGLASRVIPSSHFYALVTGLGYTFHGNSYSRSLLRNIVSLLYKVSLSRADKVIFQNPDDLNEFVLRRILPKSKCELVNGSGVNTKKFDFTLLPGGKIIFLSIGRLLVEKGFREYSQAAKIVKKKYPDTVFQLLGPEDSSPDGISRKEVESWDKEEWIEYLGSTSDVRPYLKNCHIYVLPSYHEGMPRTVLEAMAVGRPILTTDVPGCRETVIPSENGYLVPKADAQALAERMIWFIENREQWERMGKRSRVLAEEKYDVHKVNAKLTEIMGL